MFVYVIDVVVLYVLSCFKNVFNSFIDVSIVVVVFAFSSTFKFMSVVNGFLIFGKFGSLDFGFECVFCVDFFEFDFFEGVCCVFVMVVFFVVELIFMCEC